MMNGKEEEAPDATTDDGGSIFDKGKSLFQSLTKNDAPMAIGTEGKADCPSCTKQIDFSQYSNQRGDEINAGNPFSCPHCSQLLLRWEPDSAVSNCNDCSVKFFSFRSWNDIVRKHHCRMCGKIYCSECLTLCRVAGFGWEIHGNWIKLKLCKGCEGTNKETNAAMQKAKDEAAAAPAEAEAEAAAVAPAAVNATAAVEADPVAPVSEAIAELKVAEPKKPKAKKKAATSMFDDDISFIKPASGDAGDKPKKEKKKKPAALNMFDGGEGSPEKQSLFD